MRMKENIIRRESVNLREKADKITENILQINRLVHMRHHELAQKYKLTLDQFHLLVHLNYKEESPTISQIAARSGKAQNTISEKVSRLEEKNLVQRIRDENDRRVSRVVMTDKGMEIINKISHEAKNEFIFEAISKMDKDTVENLLNGLDSLVDKLNNK